jgi:hypothetical protein
MCADAALGVLDGVASHATWRAHENDVASGLACEQSSDGQLKIEGKEKFHHQKFSGKYLDNGSWTLDF